MLLGTSGRGRPCCQPEGLAGAARPRLIADDEDTAIEAEGQVRQVQDRDWSEYLFEFHAERAGITDDVLERALDTQGRTPYDWLAQALQSTASAHPDEDPRPLLLDLACGSGAMASRLSAWRYLGADVSTAELRRARTHGLTVVRADAARLPLPDSSVDAVVMSMALMLVPLQDSLDEVRRVLRPGGVLAATVPHYRPMPVRDWLRYARLCFTLRHPGLSYPNDGFLVDAHAAFRAAGLMLQQDAEGAFAYCLDSNEAADRLLASLYLPSVELRRMAAGNRVVRRWVGSTMTIPVRLLVATARPV